MHTHKKNSVQTYTWKSKGAGSVRDRQCLDLLPVGRPMGIAALKSLIPSELLNAMLMLYGVEQCAPGMEIETENVLFLRTSGRDCVTG